MTENKIYKIVMRMKLDDEKGVCAICPIHSGCNKSKSIRSWKKHRQKQYKKTS